MRNAIIAVAALLGLGFLLGSTGLGTVKPDPKQIHAERVKRGEFLVTIGGCNDCHTPLKMGPKGPEPDWTRRLSGHPEGLVMPPAPKLPEGPWLWVGAGTNTAFAGPWGVSYARNLTPERLTGTGIWTEEMFIQTLRTGKHWGVSRPILPPMPWQNLQHLPEEDLKAIWAYLQSLEPIKNQVPDAVLAQ
ncbi:MAG TPA: diheme cytochrome c-553 [Thermoanaerobaculia bacterium]|nr:diheme cytochrome c-553 [Thermoanaerobaculia bacterium]